MAIIGIDEVGRGCWAGPLVAGAVMLGKPINGLTDSKLLSAARRKQLSIDIYAHAAAWGLGWVSATEVDVLGLTAAVKLAMERAVQCIGPIADEIIIDGNYNYLPQYQQAHTLIKADLTIPSVSAASIIAKVARDEWMAQVAKDYPEYGFERHVGYGTKQHQAALSKMGPCPIHRLSYKPVSAAALLHKR